MAVAALKGHLAGGDYPMEGKPTCWRRVFVQTDNGSVLGMELDRSDNAHTVKRRVQLALNIPIDESSLTFGDTVLKNDLTAVQNNSPLLLTRNQMHRSSSTPCMSPTGLGPQRRDRSGPVEILGRSDRTKQLVKEVVKGMKSGVGPTPVRGGLGGAYYFKDVRGESIAIVKPTDEEPFAPNNPKGFVGRVLGGPGLKRSIRVGETGFREVAAYLLDHGGFACVPRTALVKITHSIFNVNGGGDGAGPDGVSKIASLQEYVRHDFDAGDHGTSSFPVAAVHRIGILDVRILNTDRHAGNLLVRKVNNGGGFGGVELIPIDHGLCLPESLEDPYFEWVHWPQASIPFSDDELEYIKNLDPIRDRELLRGELPMMREACLRVLFLCTAFLKAAAASGLCLAEIGEMMSREFRGGAEGPSELEVICIEARRLFAASEIPSPVGRVGFDEIQFDFDCDDEVPLSRLKECVEEEDEESEVDEGGRCLASFWKFPTGGRNISELSAALDNTGVGGRNREFGSLVTGSLSNEQIPASANFVKLGDMTEGEWGLFFDKFEELLRPEFAGRKSAVFGQKQRQRLGTSCKF